MKGTKLIPVVLMDCDIRSIEGVISSYGRRGVEVIALSAQRDTPPPAFKSKYVRHTYYSPKVSESPAYLDFLLELPHRGVLVYSSDAGAEFVSQHQEVLRRAGYRLNIAAYETFRRGFDKDKIFKECQACGVPTMKTKEIESVEDLYAAAEAFGLPLILKPTRLAGGAYRKVTDTESIPEVYAYMRALIRSEEHAAQQSCLIAQEFVAHHHQDIYCCETYYPANRSERRFLSIQKVRPNINYDGTVGSRLYAGQTVEQPELERLSAQILDHLGWKGFAHLDWLYSQKYERFLLCEINPRLPGFSNFTTAVGFDMAWYYYADLTARQAKPFRFRRALYFEALRHPGDLTTNLLAVKKGHLSLWAFLQPYLKIFTFRYKVVMDVYYGADLGLTWANYKISFRNLLKKISRP